MNAQGEENDVIKELKEVIEEVGVYEDYRKTQRKECFSLVRRMKLLVPLLEEISQLGTLIPYEATKCLCSLRKVLKSAKKLLKSCNHGSKIYLAIEAEMIMGRFHSVYDKISQALDGMPYDELGIADEVKEQVELLRTQLKRAKKRTDTQDIVLAMDMMVVLSTTDDHRNADSAILERLANKLELQTITELKVEAMAVRTLIRERNGRNHESTQQILDLFNKCKQTVGLEDFSLLDDPATSEFLDKYPLLSIPNEFLCPITLEIMTDPVIVASGQTYERESIQKWLQSNRNTCPKTRQTLGHLSLAPNFALRNLILQWCHKNNYELPKKKVRAEAHISLNKYKEIFDLVRDLGSNQPDAQRKAVMKIRILSKQNPDNRVTIANCGGIPPLVQLLSYQDSNIQEHAVTALLNLSIEEANKKHIARAGAIPAVIDILQNGKVEAKENSAACLFSLSVLDENKVTIGSLNGIPPLVNLLQNGTARGKKDAATALFNLSLNQMNKARAIRAGIVKPLLQLLDDNDLDMVDEALSILLLLATHPEGRHPIGQLSFIETLVKIIESGTPKNKECAIAVLLELGSHDSSFVLAALQYGVYDNLLEVSKTGTNRAQRKANSLLQLMSKCEHIP